MMKNRKILYFCVAALSALALIFGAIIWQSKTNELKVIFLDVGQGDSILISHGSQQLLIDGGKDGKMLLEKLGKYIPFWDRKIEVIIETHPDQDHVGGLIGVLEAYKVNEVLQTKMQSDSQTFKKLENEIEKNGSEKIEAKEGLTIKFAEDIFAQILYPSKVANVKGKDTNGSSVALKLTAGENKFLFTGDLPSEQEGELLAESIDLQAQILKVSHHGSKYATSETFLEKVKPNSAVISVGKNNSYGHPNAEILQRLRARKIKIARTDESGDVVYRCKNINDECIIEN
jgi:beta-lactamase superfamily II metal-dependent hydrolase